MFDRFFFGFMDEYMKLAQYDPEKEPSPIKTPSPEALKAQQKPAANPMKGERAALAKHDFPKADPYELMPEHRTGRQPPVIGKPAKDPTAGIFKSMRQRNEAAKKEEEQFPGLAKQRESEADQKRTEFEKNKKMFSRYDPQSLTSDISSQNRQDALRKAYGAKSPKERKRLLGLPEAKGTDLTRSIGAALGEGEKRDYQLGRQGEEATAKQMAKLDKAKDEDRAIRDFVGQYTGDKQPSRGGKGGARRPAKPMGRGVTGDFVRGVDDKTRQNMMGMLTPDMRQKAEAAGKARAEAQASDARHKRKVWGSTTLVPGEGGPVQAPAQSAGPGYEGVEGPAAARKRTFEQAEAARKAPQVTQSPKPQVSQVSSPYGHHPPEMRRTIRRIPMKAI